MAPSPVQPKPQQKQEDSYQFCGEEARRCSQGGTLGPQNQWAAGPRRLCEVAHADPGPRGEGTSPSTCGP